MESLKIAKVKIKIAIIINSNNCQICMFCTFIFYTVSHICSNLFNFVQICAAMHTFCACSRSAQDGDQHPQDGHPPSPRRSTPFPRIVTHHPWNGHPTFLGRSPTILRTVSHHLQDDHSPASGWSHS